MTEAHTGFGELRHSQDDLSQAEFIAKQAMNGMATATLALVKAVGASTVDVQPMVHQIDGAGKAIPHGVVHGLPVFTFRAGASAIIVKPRVGDIGLVVFCSSDISAAKKNKAPSQPGSRRRFDWADGLYIGGFLGPAPTQTITIDDDVGITVQGSASKPVTINAPGGLTINGAVTVVGALTQTGNQTVTGTITATQVVGGGKTLSTHTHSGVTTGAGTSGPPS
jgi:phage baseplate assembly protein gpV